MSTKSLRLLQKEREKLALVSIVERISEDEVEECATNKIIRNVFDLLRDDNSDNDDQDEGVDETPVTPNPQKQKKNKKRKKNKQKVAKDTNDNGDDLEAVLNELRIETPHTKVAVETPSTSSKDILRVEHKYLNQDNELKKIFGSHVVEGNKRSHNSRNVKRYRLVNPRPNWGGLERSGVSMELIERRGDELYFAIEHSRSYREVQYLFLGAVDSVDPSNVMNIVRQYPFHIDTLLQICEICKLSEDWEMATEIIERAVHIFERGFHPLFSLTQGTCRLDYTKRENRGFYLSLFQHLTFLGRKGCYRTSLEFCKLILSLSPDSDPLGMLLLLDLYALKSEEFEFLVKFYQTWSDSKNLFQLPNFAFSYPLALFNLATQTKDTKMLQLSDETLCDALLMYPSVLKQLIEKCSVVADDIVNKHEYFNARQNESEPLKLLVRLYVMRTFSCWKDLKVMAWVEKNVHHLMKNLSGMKELTEQYSHCRATRYVGIPRNIYRHLIISEVKDLSYELPASMTTQSITHYDPLPPLNSTASYDQTNRSANRSQPQASSLSSVFLQSLFPSFNPNDIGASGGENERGGELVRAGGAFIDSLRGLLTSLRYVPPENDNQDENQDGEWEEDIDN